MILGIQLIGIIFALSVMYFTYMSYKRNDLTKVELVFWLNIWIIFLIVTIFPNILNSLVSSLSITRTMDFFTIIGFLFLITITFYNYIIVKKNNNKVDRVVRNIALNAQKINMKK